jgi:hypothetical protein
MKRSLLTGAVVLLCASALLAACAQNSGEPAPQPSEQEQSTQDLPNDDGLTESAPEAPYRMPLTGMPADTELTSRPFVVMVENSPAARPQSGLHKADIVYEILAEGDITRFIAVYQSQSAEKIGPVRSIRPYFVEIGAGLDAVIVHAGWSQDAMNLIAKKKLNHMDQVYGDHDYYWREKSRKAPHNLYTSTELMKKGMEAKKFHEDWDNPVLAFAKSKEEANVQGQEHGAVVTIPYLQGYSAGYNYDAGSGLYRKLLKGEPHTDAETGEQITAGNILIGEAKHRVLDDAGRREVDVFGPAAGYLLQGGKVREITWENRDGAIRAFADGTEIPLLPGQTWVHIVPNLSKVDLGMAAAAGGAE